MINFLKESLWKQFGASIDMLKKAIILWPEEYWNSVKRFYYISYHTIIFLDYYLTIPPTNFSSPLPFTITERANVPEDAVDDVMPSRVYSKKELLEYLIACRTKCHILIEGLTEEKFKQQWIDEPDELAGPDTIRYSVLEILFYNMRHVQHHTAQLNILLREKINITPDWVSDAED